MSSRWHGVVQIGEGLFQIGFGECLWGRTIMPSLSFLSSFFIHNASAHPPRLRGRCEAGLLGVSIIFVIGLRSAL